MSKKIFIGSKIFGHDSAIFAILFDEQRVFGIATERLTRYKHDNLYPFDAINKLVDYFNIDAKKIDEVFFGSSFTSHKEQLFSRNYCDREILKRKFFGAKFIGDYVKSKNAYRNLSFFMQFRNLLLTSDGRRLLLMKFLNIINLKRKIKIETVIRPFLENIFPNSTVKINYYDHEYCHAISSYISSGFSTALLVTMDGYGDENCFSRAYIANESQIMKVAESKSPIRALRLPLSTGAYAGFECSIGGLYSYFTDLLGYVPNADEGKVEALAALGNPIKVVLDALNTATQLDQTTISISMDHRLLSQFFTAPQWQEICKNNNRADLAASIQKYAEDSVLEYVKLLVLKTGVQNLCLSGGVFANVIINMKIYEQITQNIYIVPAVADDGSAQGAAFSLLLDEKKSLKDFDWIARKAMPYFGTSYDKADIFDRLSRYPVSVDVIDLGDDWPIAIAQRVVDGEIGALFHGRMEWGPRALGNRSIIADARNVNSKKLLNESIKKREPFQPFCPSILSEEKDRLFDDAYLNKHMTSAFRMKAEFWDKLPGAIHVDGTARVQFVSHNDNPRYFELIRCVKDLTGFGVILNTSFNKHGRTIVETPEDALDDFLDTNLDYLLMEGLLILRKR